MKALQTYLECMPVRKYSILLSLGRLVLKVSCSIDRFLIPSSINSLTLSKESSGTEELGISGEFTLTVESLITFSIFSLKEKKESTTRGNPTKCRG